MIYRQQAYPSASAPRRSIILKSYKDFFFLFFSLLFSRLYSLPIYQASLLCFLARLSSDLIYGRRLLHAFIDNDIVHAREEEGYIYLYIMGLDGIRAASMRAVKATISHTTKETISADKEECPRASESIILDRNKLFPFMFTPSSWGMWGLLQDRA